MKLSERIFKYATVAFITIIVGLLILTMGMPSIQSYSTDEGQFIAARVDSEAIGKQEVERAFNQMMSTQFQGIDLPDQFKQQFRSQALDQLINQRIFYVISRDAGLFPMGKASNKIVADYLKKNYPSFLTPEGFDFAKFESDLLRPNRVSMEQIRRAAEWSYALGQNDTLMRDVAQASVSRDLVDAYILQSTKISYEILYISPAQRKEINKKRANITEADIRAKFAADYLSKDPKDTLTDIKREGITESLLQERLGQIESSWMEELKNSKGNMAQAKSKFSGTLVTLSNVALSDSLQAASKTEGVNLAPLETNLQFLEERVRQGALIGPMDIDGSLYIVRITKVDTIEEELTSPDSLPSAEKDQIKSNLANLYVDALYRQMIDLSKKNINVIRY